MIVVAAKKILETVNSHQLPKVVPVIEVSRRLGQSRASITLDVYGRLIPGMQSEVAKFGIGPMADCVDI